MTAPRSPTESTSPLALANVLTIENVGGVRDDMLAILVNGGGAVVLFGARVEQVDTAGLQLLVVFARELQESGRPWDWDGISPALRKAATRLGLLEVLRMGPDAPAHAREARQ